MDTPDRIAFPTTHASVPEHSVAFMEAMSGGTSFIQGNYLFFTADDWLTAIGYPLQGEYNPHDFDQAICDALATHPCQTHKTIYCWAIAPSLPERLLPHHEDSDVYFTIPTIAAPPRAMQRHLRIAAEKLRIEEGREFTAAHRKLWAEFLAKGTMKPQIRALFARTSSVLNAPHTDLRLLNAWDSNGHLAACLLVDFAPQRFCSYLLGAHSRQHYTPHASDLLFAHMVQASAIAGKEHVDLGLGINDGIRRFKMKWGGTPTLAYQVAAWTETTKSRTATTATTPDPGDFLRQMLTARPMSRQALLDSLPQQRPYAMVWELEKSGRTSWIGGTAHAFKYSFESSFRTLFHKVDTVIFEGPLDAASMAVVARHGHTMEADTPCLAELLSETEIRHLERVVRGPEGWWARMLNMNYATPADVRFILQNTRPWYAFFALWHAFLERHGWKQSVDLEAHAIALQMGRNIISMESIDEQLISLESIPLERILRFLHNASTWKQRMETNTATYLAGDLNGMMGTSTEFPTRTEQVIGTRDQRFRERMRPHIEAGRCAVFVGTAHLLNLRDMLREDGFSVRQIYPTLRHAFKAKFRGRKD